MTFAATALLGASAGLTIYIGLPVGRMPRIDGRLRVSLAMFSVGILAFIFMDVTSHAQEIVNASLASFKDHKTAFTDVLGLFSLLAVGFAAGTAGLSLIERALRRRRVAARLGGGEPGAVRTSPGLAGTQLEAHQAALKTGMTIAGAIGLHNFAEGLAIGVSARAGAIGLATMLIIGFGLHNATEGFGIVGPLGGVRPSWKWLGLAGLVGGGPTFLGTIIGYQVQSDPVELCFYAVAGGAILYVIGEIWTGMHRYGHRTVGVTLLAAGFIAGIGTDMVVSYGGG